MAQPANTVLRQIYQLDRSSPDFHDELDAILCGEAYERCKSKFVADDAKWFVDYLDKVNLPHHPSRFPLKLVQVLEDLDPFCPAFRKYLRELKTICGTCKILPTSYTALALRGLEINDRYPYAFGVFSDVYKATIGTLTVCVKRPRRVSGGQVGVRH